MITINTNTESQTASKQQEMPEAFFFFILLASWILLPRLEYNQKLTPDQKQKVRSKRPASSSHNMSNSPFLKGQNSPALSMSSRHMPIVFEQDASFF